MVCCLNSHLLLHYQSNFIPTQAFQHLFKALAQLAFREIAQFSMSIGYTAHLWDNYSNLSSLRKLNYILIEFELNCWQNLKKTKQKKHEYFVCYKCDLLRNEFNFLKVHGILNTSGLLQSK